jgi:hypothetical protein
VKTKNWLLKLAGSSFIQILSDAQHTVLLGFFSKEVLKNSCRWQQNSFLQKMAVEKYR